MIRNTCLQLCEKIAKCNSIDECIFELESILSTRMIKGYFRKYCKKLVDGLRSNKPFFAIISKNGNSKLPFYAFSSLPIFSCPGAGECIKWCYSLKAWRYPAAFFRQIQNFILLKHSPNLVAESFGLIKPNAPFRLYVDGDFSCHSDVIFWFNLLKSRSDINCYGYSKSWDLIYSCRDFFPSNYSLNISSGGKAQTVSKQEMLDLAITRGEFIVVPVTKLTPERQKIRFSLPEYHSEVRTNGKEITGKNGFSCPGKCGDCANGSHACGNDKFKGIPIYIGVH